MCPVITFDKPWTGFLGDDYPFRMAGFTQAYAMVNEFATDYAGQYERFAAWEKTTWRDFVYGPKNRATIEAVDALLVDHQKQLFARLAASEGGAVYKEIVAACDAQPDDTVDALKVARAMDRFVDKGDSYAIPIGKRPNLYLLKPYMNMGGWIDTNEPGVFRRPKTEVKA